MVVTEKIDGTNAQILITEDGRVFAGSRTRWITPEADNYGFAAWVRDHRQELLALGPGSHFGEWWGSGIQRRDGLNEKRFSLFNVGRWLRVGEQPVNEKQTFAPECCHVVPTLYRGPFETITVDQTLTSLTTTGSHAAPGFMNPEGVVIFHESSRTLFKKTLDKNDTHKSVSA
jgi:hypothetical protein